MYYTPNGKSFGLGVCFVGLEVSTDNQLPWWNQLALRATFHHAFSPEIKDELAFWDPAPDHDIDVAIQIDHCLREC